MNDEGYNDQGGVTNRDHIMSKCVTNRDHIMSKCVANRDHMMSRGVVNRSQDVKGVWLTGHRMSRGCG